MGFIIIYQEENFGFVEKNNVNDAFTLPGQFFVFEERAMVKQFGNFYKDPFVFYKSKEEILRFKINELELVDSQIHFTYNSNFSITFTLYDCVNCKTYSISTSGLNHTKALPLALSFLVKTMSNHPANREWKYYELEQENIRLKTEIEKLKNDMKIKFTKSFLEGC